MSDKTGAALWNLVHEREDERNGRCRIVFVPWGSGQIASSYAWTAEEEKIGADNFVQPRREAARSAVMRKLRQELGL